MVEVKARATALALQCEDAVAWLQPLPALVSRRALASYPRYTVSVEQARAALDRVAGEEAADFRKLLCGRLKVVESAGEDARVCAEQLCAYAEWLEGAIAAGDAAGPAAEGVVTIIAPLLAAVPAPVPSFTALDPHLPTVCAQADAFAGFREGVEVSLTRVGGTGLTSYLVGPSLVATAHNLLTLTFYEACGHPFTGVDPADVTVAGAGVRVAIAASPSPGTLSLHYTVPDCTFGQLPLVTLHIFAFGRPLPGSPFEVRPCLGTGTQRRVLPMASGTPGGLAVSPDASCAFVSFPGTHRVEVYNLGSGERVGVFGSQGAGPGQFQEPRGLACACTPIPTLLVAETGSHRVQEVTLTGTHTRMLGQGLVQCPNSVAVSGGCLAVGCAPRGDAPSVWLLDYDTGDVVRSFGPAGSGRGCVRKCTGLGFAPEDGGVIVCDSGGRDPRAVWFSAGGEFVRNVHTPCASVAFTAAGEIVLGDPFSGRVCVCAPDGSAVARAWPCASPVAIAVAGPLLCVLTPTGIVQFE